MMNCQNVIYAIAIAFQICGGIVLLLNSICKGKDKVKIKYVSLNQSSIDTSVYNIIIDEPTLCLLLKELYMNRIAFTYLIIGYATSIFGSANDNKVSILVCITIFGAILTTLTLCIARIFAKIMLKSYISELQGR